MRAQRIVCIAAEGFHGVGGVAASPVALFVDEDADACPAVDRVVFEQVDRPDRLGTQQRLDDQPQLSVAEHPDDVLMPFDEALQLMTRERLRRPADRPDVAVVLPLVHQVDIARLHGPQADGAALDVHYNPMILLRISMATPQALAFSVIFDPRNLVSL